MTRAKKPAAAIRLPPARIGRGRSLAESLRRRRTTR